MVQKDDLEAVRTIVAALDGFAADEQERIIRWAREKVNLPSGPLSSSPAGNPTAGQQLPPSSIAGTPAGGQATTKDLRSFVAAKKPKSDVQFAATVAYYYRFEAPEGQRKPEIVAEDLAEACRLANRERLRSPLQTLSNARMLGLLDSPRRGAFAINAVGENLVAMTLPSDGSAGVVAPKRRAEKKGTRKTGQKKTAKK